MLYNPTLFLAAYPLVLPMAFKLGAVSPNPAAAIAVLRMKVRLFMPLVVFIVLMVYVLPRDTTIPITSDGVSLMKC